MTYFSTNTDIGGINWWDAKPQLLPIPTQTVTTGGVGNRAK